ncbi:MAG: class I SAM-dependent methyltransferase, partial [Pseudomonadales bacterium]
MKLLLSALLFIALPLTVFAKEDVPPTTEVKIKAALEHERRSDAERERDRNRKPLETLEFFRLEHDQTVLELVPGGGWYTKILGPVLEERGKLYLSIDTRRVAELIKGEGFGSSEVVPFEGITRSETDQRRYTAPEFSFGIRKVDLVLTFRNLHNFDDTGRYNLNKAAFDALKKGGLYGVIDHTRRHMAADTAESWRRMDPVQMIKEIESAGFRLVDYSTLHYRPDDELRYEVGRKTVTGNTDRFTLLFEKP